MVYRIAVFKNQTIHIFVFNLFVGRWVHGYSLVHSTEISHLNLAFINIPFWILTSGDIVKGNGSGGESIYGEKFDDENFMLAHNKPYTVSMASFDKNCECV